MTALFAGMVMTDRFGIAIGSFPLGLTMPLAYVLLAVLLLNGRLALDALSLALFAGLTTVGVLSFLLNATIDGGNRTSVLSLWLMLAIYLPFVFNQVRQPDTQGHWLWMMRTAGNVLLIVAIAGIVQFYAQFVIRTPWLFDISKLIPDPIRAQGIYNSAIPVGSIFKANGLFCREPSNFSFWMAFGLLIELALFKRVKRMLCFGLALLLSYSGTGLLTLAFGLLFPFRPRLLAWVGAGLVLILGSNALAGDPLNLAFTFSRFGEFSARGSSAYARYVAPMFLVDASFETTPWAVWLGHGPGTIQQSVAAFDSHDPTWAKLLFEYGIVGFVVCVGFVAYRLGRFPAPFQFRSVLFANWLVMGGYLLTPETVYVLYVVLGMWPGPAQQGLALASADAA
ncbi:MAG: hypothetical protein Q7T97_13025 [Burkholderiaceae bacterium]|nr:hypothetical protein [Burkholderiaceae bacterium]